MARLFAPRTLFPIPLSDPELFTASLHQQEFIRTDPLSLREATLAGLSGGNVVDTERLAELRADPAAYVIYTSGSTGDAKGEPTQINSISHGCSPTRFRQINVILTD